MDFLDYRKKLGIGFCDEEKYRYFLARIHNILNMIAEGYDFETVSPEEYAAFCDLTGTAIDYEALNNTYTCRERYKHCLATLDRHNRDLRDFLSYYIAFANSIKAKKEDENAWTRGNFIAILTKALEESHIQFETLVDGEEHFIFPKGAIELDSALVSQPLEWLKDYPKSHKTYCTALRQYSDGIFIRDVADNLRKTLEGFLQEFLCNDKNLETNKNEICKYLGAQGIDAGISGLFQPLINAYKNINDRIAKHNDKVDKKMLEFLLYQTGVLIRMVLTVKQADAEEPTDAD